MNKEQSGFSAVVIMAAVALLVLLFGIGFYIIQRQQSLSAGQINKKFDCDRITLDFRDTDVFCANPKFYNDPGSITRDDYYIYYGCESRLSGPPPSESVKTQDPGLYNAYYDCKDEAKLEVLRQNFVIELMRIKTEAR